MQLQPLQLAGGAFVDELAKHLSRTLPAAGWPQARVHLIEPQAWPDSAYDQVLLIGAQRGRLAQAQGAPVPLLSPTIAPSCGRSGWISSTPSSCWIGSGTG